MTKRIVLLQALASTPDDVSRLVRSQSEEEATRRERESAWSARDVVEHLIFVERAYLARLRRVVTEDRPFLPVIAPGRADGDNNDIQQLAACFREAREATLGLLRDMSPGGWQRPAVHETNGPTTLRFLVQMLVDHDIEHTNQLVEIRQRGRTTLKGESAAN